MRIQKRNPDQTDQPTCSKRLKVDTFGGVDHGDNNDNNKDGKRCNGKGQCKCRGFDPQFQCTNSTKLERANISMQRQHYRRGRNMGVQTDFDMSDTTSSDLPGPSTNSQGSNTQQQSGSNQNDELITTKTTVNASEVVSKSNNADTNVESNNIESTDNQNVTDNTSLNSTDDKEMSGTNNIESTDSEEQQTSTNSSSQNITNEEMDNTNDYENTHTKHLQNSGTNTTNESNKEGDNTNRSEDGNEDQGNQNEQEQVFYYFF